MQKLYINCRKKYTYNKKLILADVWQKTTKFRKAIILN